MPVTHEDHTRDRRPRHRPPYPDDLNAETLAAWSDADAAGLVAKAAALKLVPGEAILRIEPFEDEVAELRARLARYGGVPA